MAVKVEVSTLKQNEQALKGLEGFKKVRPQYVMVGYIRNHPKEPREEGGHNSFLAYIHEHGSPIRNIPARPFLMPAFKSEADTAEAFIKEGLSSEVESPGSIAKGLGFAGMAIQTKAQNNIANSVNMKPLSPLTIAQRQRPGFNGQKNGFKGTSPLNVSGQLKGALHFVVK